jgi:hypothetical protein
VGVIAGLDTETGEKSFASVGIEHWSSTLMSDSILTELQYLAFKISIALMVTFEYNCKMCKGNDY